jgi:hypothetical protein
MPALPVSHLDVGRCGAQGKDSFTGETQVLDRTGKRRQSSGSERIFEDDTRRLWFAGQAATPRGNEAVVFTCLSDAREAQRAVVLDVEVPLTAEGSDLFRVLLRRAPRLGRL